MALNHAKAYDAQSGPVIFDNNSQSSLITSISDNVAEDSKQLKSSTAAYLDVPTSRPSLESAFSDYSELSYHSNDPETHHSLIRRLSRSYEEPGNSSFHPPRSRIVSALHSFYVANYGALLVLLSQFFGSLMNVATRLLETPGSHGAPMHPFQILFARQSITAFLCTTFALTTKSIPDFPLGPKGTVRYLLVIRGLCGFFGVFGLYFSLLYLPLSEATVLTFLAPILTCYMCSLLIPGETFSRQQQLAGFLSLVGVVFIAQPASLFTPSPTHPSTTNSTILGSGVDPALSTLSNSTISSSPNYHHPTTPTPSQHLTAIGVAMLGVLGATGAMTSIRSIGTRAHPFLSINYFSVWCTIVSLLALLIFPSVHFRFPGNALEWGLMGTLGLCGFIMQFLLTAGLSYGGPSTPVPLSTSLPQHSSPSASASMTDPTGSSHPPKPAQSTTTQSQIKSASLKKGSGTRATSMVYTQMLFALAGDKFVFGVSPGVMSWVGSGLILAGAIWVAAARDQVKTVARAGAGAVERGTGDDVADAGDDGSTFVQVSKSVAARKAHRGDVGDEEETVGLMSAAEAGEGNKGARQAQGIEMHDLRGSHS